MSGKMVDVLEKLTTNLSFFVDKVRGELALKIGKIVISEENFGLLFNEHFTNNYNIILNIGKKRTKFYTILMKLIEMVKFILYLLSRLLISKRKTWMLFLNSLLHLTQESKKSRKKLF